MATKNEIALEISELHKLTEGFDIASALLKLHREDESELEYMSSTEATDMILSLVGI